MRAGIALFEALAEDVGEVALAECQLEALFAGGVDAFADDCGGGVAEFDGVGGAGDPRAGLAGDGKRRDAAAGAAQGRQVGGGGAATAAEYAGTGSGDVRHLRGEVVGADVVHGATRLDARESGVGFDDDGQRRKAHELGGERRRHVRSETAVEAQGVHAEALQKRDDGSGVGPGEELAVGPEGDGGKHGQVAGLLRGEDGGLEFVDVAHRLDGHEVGARVRPGADLFGEGGNRVFEREVAKRREKFARGPDVEGDETVAAPRRVAGAARGGDTGRRPARG